jgi:hypothetical protein
MSSQGECRPRAFPAAAGRPRYRALQDSAPGETTEPGLNTAGLPVTHGSVSAAAGRPRSPARQLTS